MSHWVVRLASASVMTLVAAAAQAQPMVATFTGYVDVLDPSEDPVGFTAKYYFNTVDLRPSAAANYLDALPTSSEWASYSDSVHGTYSFLLPTAFSLGEYYNVIQDGNGNTTGVKITHDYSIMTGNGSMTMQFGGLDDTGTVNFNGDGSRYANLITTSYAVTDSDISPVPLPASVWLFGVALLGLAGFGYQRRSTTASA